MAEVDFAASLLLAGVVAMIGLAYVARALVLGPAHFARVDRDGGSRLLGKRVMEMAYWSLQPIGRACARVGISANGVTGFSLLLAAFAGIALAFGHLGVAAVFAALAAFGDAIDGWVARATHTASPAGAVFDAAVDRYSEFFFLGGLAFAYRANGVVLAVVLATLLGSFMVSYASAKAEALDVQVPRGSMRRAERAFYLTFGAALSPIIAHYTAFVDAPMIAALALVAVIANVSAFSRLRIVARLAAEQHDSAAESGPRPTQSAAAVWLADDEDDHHAHAEEPIRSMAR